MVYIIKWNFPMGMIEQLILAKERLAKQKSEIIEHVMHQLRAYKSDTLQRYGNNTSLFEEYFNKKSSDEINEELRDLTSRFKNDESSSPIMNDEFVGDWLLVSQSMIDGFAAVTRDEQWIHLDVERARRELPYKSTVAHGFLILSLIPVLTTNRKLMDVTNQLPKTIVNCGLSEVQFLAPLKSNTRVRARVKRRSTEPQRNGSKVTEEITIETNAFKTVCKAVVIYRMIF